ncbi:MAG: hypothetical protein RR198_05085 [Oscillospiraceae bacterium]
MEIWKTIAINDLKRFGVLESSLTSINERIEALNSKMEGGSLSVNKLPVQGGGTSQEDKWNDCITLKGNLLRQKKSKQLEYNAIKRALACLTDDERKVLNYAYINRSQGHMERIMRAMCVEKTRAYELKDEALSSFVMAMYGE